MYSRNLMTKDEFAELLWGHFKSNEAVKSIEVRKGQIMQGSLRFSDVWVNEGGRWLYVGGHDDLSGSKRRRGRLV